MYNQPVLHSIRSLLCIITRVTHCRRSFNGYSLPTFLTQPSLVLIKKIFATYHKTFSCPKSRINYVYVKLRGRCESSVSIRDLASKSGGIIHPPNFNDISMWADIVRINGDN